MTKKQLTGFLVAVFVLAVSLSPKPVQAGGVDGAFTGVIDAHVNMRMADAVVDLVRVSSEESSVWAVAGFLYYDHGLVYVSNGVWSSSAEVAGSVGKTVRLSPYRDKNPRIRRLEELFSSARYLFWRIRILEGDLYDYQFEQII